jgi:hypothetical protein
MWLGKDISKLFVGLHMKNDNIPLDFKVSQEIMSDVYVIGSRMLIRVASNL